VHRSLCPQCGWRLLAPVPDDLAFGDEDRYPAGVVRYQDGETAACDPEGQQPDWRNDLLWRRFRSIRSLSSTSYQLRGHEHVRREEYGWQAEHSATYLPSSIPAGPVQLFGIAVLQEGRAHLRDLGSTRSNCFHPPIAMLTGMGLCTTNYFTTDHDLGWYGRDRKTCANHEFARLIRACHQNGVRFFADVVMAFSARNPYRSINFPISFVKANAGDPEEYSQASGDDGFGSDLFKYIMRSRPTIHSGR